MAPDPNIRCSDADREAVAQQLRDHYAAGRLTLDEFDERTTTTYAAKTFGDLDGLLTDLPALAVEPAAPKPSVEPVRASASDRVENFRAFVAPASAWIAVSMVCTLLWAAGDNKGGFWPIWVIGPWGVMMVLRWLHGGNNHDRRAMIERRMAEDEARRQAIRDNRRGS